MPTTKSSFLSKVVRDGDDLLVKLPDELVAVMKKTVHVLTAQEIAELDLKEGYKYSFLSFYGDAADQFLYSAKLISQPKTTVVSKPRPEIDETWQPPNIEALKVTVTVPAENPYYILSDSMSRRVDMLGNRQDTGDRLNVMLLGPASSGKTEFTRVYAQKKGYAYYSHNCATMRDVSSWWGRHVFIDGETKFLPSPLYYALRRGNCVILLDEINRTIDPIILNPLLNLLDDTRQTYIHDTGEILEVGSHVVIFGAANIGVNFVGTHQMDEAILSRFTTTLEFDLPESATVTEILVRRTGISRMEAGKIVRCADAINKIANSTDFKTTVSHPVGIRTLLETARWMRSGMDFADALADTVLRTYSKDGGAASERSKVKQVLYGTLGESGIFNDV